MKLIDIIMIKFVIIYNFKMTNDLMRGLCLSLDIVNSMLGFIFDIDTLISTPTFI